MHIKRTFFRNILTLALLIAFCLSSLISCGGSNSQTYTMGELTYTLPTYLKQFPYSGSDAAYRNTSDTVFIFIHSLNADKLTSEGLDSQVSVEDYVAYFIDKNGFDEDGMELDLEYNDAKTKVTFDVVIGAAPDDNEDEEDTVLQYYFYTVVRGTDAIYVCQMLCDESNATSYVGLFKEWSAGMSAS